MDGKDYKQNKIMNIDIQLNKFVEEHKERLQKLSDKVLFDQATLAMEEIYGYGCDTEIDAYFRGAKWAMSAISSKN